MHLKYWVHFKPEAFNYTARDYSSQGENLIRSDKTTAACCHSLTDKLNYVSTSEGKTALLRVPEECDEAIQRV